MPTSMPCNGAASEPGSADGRVRTSSSSGGLGAARPDWNHVARVERCHPQGTASSLIYGEDGGGDGRTVRAARLGPMVPAPPPGEPDHVERARAQGGRRPVVSAAECSGAQPPLHTAFTSAPAPTNTPTSPSSHGPRIRSPVQRRRCSQRPHPRLLRRYSRPWQPASGTSVGQPSCFMTSARPGPVAS